MNAKQQEVPNQSTKDWVTNSFGTAEKEIMGKTTNNREENNQILEQGENRADMQQIVATVPVDQMQREEMTDKKHLDETEVVGEIVQHQQTEGEEKVMENILPLAIQVDNQKEVSNRDNADLDEGDMNKTIYQIGVEGNLSPRQIEKMKSSQGIQKMKEKGFKTSSMQTKNSEKKRSK